MSILLRTEGLSKAFTLHLQGGTRIPVLGQVDLAVSAGECVALSGPSGAGKSTLMRCRIGGKNLTLPALIRAP
jgi:alpha-D-ribose 1-methylphosphonate 5-triphosphate synthase subunit PhnL